LVCGAGLPVPAALLTAVFRFVVEPKQTAPSSPILYITGVGSTYIVHVDVAVQLGGLEAVNVKVIVFPASAATDV
jgi:hypothetical protein